MRRSRRIGLTRIGAVVGLVAGAGGCASDRAQFRPAQLNGGDSVLYVYRNGGGLGSGGAVGVYVNQERIGEVHGGQYLARVVPPGEFLVRVEGNSSAVSRVKLVAGDSAFLRVESGGWPGKTTIEDVASAVGQREIAGTTEASGATP